MTLREIISQTVGTKFFQLQYSSDNTLCKSNILDYNLVILDNNEIPKNFQDIGKLSGFDVRKCLINHGTKEVELFL